MVVARSLHSFLRQVLAALGVPCAALLLQGAFWSLFKPYVWFMFFPAVFVSSWIGSLASGLIATALSAALVLWFFVSPEHTFAKETVSPYLSAVVFVFMGVLFTFTHEGLRRAKERATHALGTAQAANDLLRSANERITELYEHTVRLDTLKSEFFANVSHELRTPLTLILGPVERLLGSDRLTAGDRQALLYIERNARGLVDEVNALLDVSKLEAGKATVEYAAIDLAKHLRETAAHFAMAAGERGVSLRVQVPETCPAQTDPAKVHRILTNLLSNALKFTPPGGTVTVELLAPEPRPGGSRATLRVTDTGPGLPPESTERIFERFFQVGEAAGRKPRGTGLGLAIAKDFAELLGGRITAGNMPTGGAVFTVEIPTEAPPGAIVSHEAMAERSEWVAPVQGLPSAEPEERPQALTQPLVLVVEDNPDMSQFIADLLREEFRVARACDGDAGLERAIALKPDLILTDLMMPGLSGEGLVRAVRARPELDRVPMVILSARGDDELRIRLLREGAQDYVTKPFAVEELRTRVRNLTTRKRAEEALAHSEEKFKDLLELAPDAILIIDQDGKIDLVNAHATDIYGYSRDELIGQPVDMLVPPRLRERLARFRESFRQRPERRTLGIRQELVGLRRGNVEFPLEVSLGPLMVTTGPCIMAIVRDIAERTRIATELARKAADLTQLEELDRLKDRFLSTISHELKTPLSLIAGYAELLQDRYPDEEFIDGILDGSRRISEHLTNILDYSALVAGAMPIAPTEVNPIEVVNNALEIEADALRRSHLHLVREFPSAAPHVQADYRRLRQMIVELVENARRFTSPGGTVTVSTRVRPDSVSIEVADTGPGIPEPERERIWEAFTLLDLKDSVGKAGLGLGLAIVKGLAERQGGTVELESQEGQGSRFIIRFPVAP